MYGTPFGESPKYGTAAGHLQKARLFWLLNSYMVQYIYELAY